MSPIERAARAVSKAHGYDPDALCANKGPKMVPLWTSYANDIRLALQAIREPSEGMVATVVQQVGDPTPDQWDIGERANAILTATNMLGETACAEVARDWQAMIDAALSE